MTSYHLNREDSPEKIFKSGGFLSSDSVTGRVRVCRDWKLRKKVRETKEDGGLPDVQYLDWRRTV
jgi:hypothetical protein